MTIEERNQLVEDNLGLVNFVVKSYFSSDMNNYDDYLQEGCCALLRAAELWDPERGIKFSTYATRAIFNTLRRYRRHYVMAKHGIHMPKHMKYAPESDTLTELGFVFVEMDAFVDSTESTRIDYFISDCKNEIDALVDEEAASWLIEEIYKQLKPNSVIRSVFDALLEYEERPTLKVLSDKLGITREAVRQNLMKIGKIANTLQKEEYGG